MIIEDVIDRLSARLRTIEGLNVLAGEVGTVSPPAAIIGLPKTTYDQTYGRGVDSMELGVVVLEPNPKQWSSYQRLVPYANGEGPKSIKVAIETPVPNEVAAFDDASVVDSDFEEWELAKVPYAACIFVIKVTGPGTT